MLVVYKQKFELKIVEDLGVSVIRAENLPPKSGDPINF